MSRPRLIALLLALGTFIVFLPVIQDDFLCYDDDFYVTNNFVAQRGLTWAGVKWAFTTFYAANWHPLTWISHMADCQLFGLNAGAHHLVNALFHATNAGLLFLVLWRMTGRLHPALVVAALFAWHPLHVETVAWVAERKDVLSTFFALLALWQYTGFVQGRRRGCYWVSLLFFALSLLSKPMFVTFPFVLLLLDFWPFERLTTLKFQIPKLAPLLVEKIPFLALAAGSCVLTLLAQQNGEAVSSLTDWPMTIRIENAIASLGRYLLMTVWPAGLAAGYPPALVPPATLILSATALALISAAVWYWRAYRFGLVGWLWFLGTLVPVIGLVQVGHAAMADRYTYFPSVGLFLAVAFGLHEWCHRSPQPLKILAGIECLVLAGCLVVTERQLSYWRNMETLFRHTAEVTKNNGAAHLLLATAYYQDDRYADALAEYRETLRLAPRLPLVHLAIGLTLDRSGQPAAALDEFQSELRRAPQLPSVHNAIGSVLAEQGDLAGAKAEFQQALQLDTRYAQPHFGLAKIYFAKGQTTDAATELLAAFHAEPNNFHVLAGIAHCLAANADAAGRDPQTALLLARKADDLSASQQAEVFDAMGMAFAATGDFTNAVICAENALEFAPVNHLNNTTPLRQRLAKYQRHEPWLESFSGTNVLWGQ